MSVSATAAHVTPARSPHVISVIGCGYLGAVHAAAMASLGHEVIGIETDPLKAKTLSNGSAPFFEPGLEELLAEGVDTGRLTFTDDMNQAARATVHFICVGTPQSESGAADLRYVDQAFDDLLSVVTPGDVVVGKSTVPVGTAERLSAQLDAHCPGATLVWNPEFLREGFAVEDTLAPDRVVIGAGSEPRQHDAAQTLLDVYDGLSDETPVIFTDLPTAELVKVAANAFLATKISFINAMAEVCERADADVTKLAEALGHDSRIGHRFLNAGLGFGGGCLPKDIRAFMHRSHELGAGDALAFLREVDLINLQRREKVVDLAAAWLGGNLVGRRIAVLGAAFKPNSDDIRDSAALAVADALHSRGADVRVTDPEANANARDRFPRLTYEGSAEAAATGADLVLLLTEWDQFRALDPVAFGTVVAEKRIIDARNALQPDAWRAAGWGYHALGRGRPEI